MHPQVASVPCLPVAADCSIAAPHGSSVAVLSLLALVSQTLAAQVLLLCFVLRVLISDGYL